MKLSKTNRWALTIFAGLIFSFPGYGVLIAHAQTQGQDAKPSSNATRIENATGEYWDNMYFKKGCNVCHSNVGQGARSGKRLVDPILPKEDFYAIVRRPYGTMPAYSPKVLSDSELADIYKYLESLKSPKAEDIPQLQRLINEEN